MVFMPTFSQLNYSTLYQVILAIKSNFSSIYTESVKMIDNQELQFDLFKGGLSEGDLGPK